MTAGLGTTPGGGAGDIDVDVGDVDDVEPIKDRNDAGCPVGQGGAAMVRKPGNQVRCEEETSLQWVAGIKKTGSRHAAVSMPFHSPHPPHAVVS